MNLIKKLMLVIICLLASMYLPPDITRADESKLNDEVETMLKQMFTERAHTLVDRKTDRLQKYYFTNQALSRNAYQNERTRTDYVNAWANKRSIKLVGVSSSIRIIRSNIALETAKISLVQSLKISYVYCDKIIPVQSFGVGTRHFMTLKKINGKWIIDREWYLDPLDENPNTIAEGPHGLAPSVKPKTAKHNSKKYNRTRAVEYADKYAGTAWGAGNKNRYNNKYLDYTSKGGDCTNFASQVIGDADEGGGLPMIGGWRYFYKSGGTQTWVQTDSFSHFLLRSGYANMIVKGDYNAIVSPSKKYADGAISQLQPGDLIGYSLHQDDTDHFSIVVGFDEYGYPLVNSHTADRYRVPFDLGWDRNTKYTLIHIKN